MKTVARLLFLLFLSSSLMFGSAVLAEENLPIPEACAFIAKYATDETSPVDAALGYTFADSLGNVFGISSPGLYSSSNRREYVENGVRLFKFNPQGAYLQTIALALPFTPTNANTFSFHYNRNGTLYVLVQEFEIEYYDPEQTNYSLTTLLDTALYRFALDGSYLGEIRVPVFGGDWTVDSQGKLYILTDNQVDSYAADGTLIESFPYEVPDNTYINARAITVNPLDELYLLIGEYNAVDGYLAVISRLNDDRNLTETAQILLEPFADDYVVWSTTQRRANAPRQYSFRFRQLRGLCHNRFNTAQNERG